VSAPCGPCSRGQHAKHGCGDAECWCWCQVEAGLLRKREMDVQAALKAGCTHEQAERLAQSSFDAAWGRAQENATVAGQFRHFAFGGAL
jgi:hypothetical protein